MRMLPKNVCTDFIVSQNTNRSKMSWVIDQIYVFSLNLLSHHNEKDKTLTELVNMMGLVRLNQKWRHWQRMEKESTQTYQRMVHKASNFYLLTQVESSESCLADADLRSGKLV